MENPVLKVLSIEWDFGALENYWNADPLRTVEKTLGFAREMTCNGIHPITQLISKIYLA